MISSEDSGRLSQATPNLAYSGIYRDQWVLIDGLWKFAQRAFYP